VTVEPPSVFSSAMIGMLAPVASHLLGFLMKPASSPVGTVPWSTVPKSCIDIVEIFTEMPSYLYGIVVLVSTP